MATEIDFGKASRTTDIEWDKACKACYDNKEVISQVYGLEAPVEYKDFNITSIALMVTLVVIALINVYLYLKVRTMQNKVDTVTADFNQRVDAGVKDWLGNYRVEEYADYMDNKFDLVITKKEGTRYADSEHPRGGTS
jgi:hypothetical protein